MYTLQSDILLIPNVLAHETTVVQFELLEWRTSDNRTRRKCANTLCYNKLHRTRKGSKSEKQKTSSNEQSILCNNSSKPLRKLTTLLTLTHISNSLANPRLPPPQTPPLPLYRTPNPSPATISSLLISAPLHTSRA
jgi:hypothetical protein